MSELVSWSNSAGETFVTFAGRMLIQSSVLIVLLFVLDLVLRRRVKAVVRYWIWLLVLVKLVLPPSLSSPTSLAWWARDTLPEAPPALVAVVPQATVTSRVAGTTEPVRPAGIAGPPSAFDTAMPQAASPAPTLNGAATSVTEPAPMVPPTWKALVLLGWLVAVALMVVLLIQRVFFVRGLLAQSEEAPNAMLARLERCRRQMRVRCAVKLRMTSVSAGPSVCGLFRPTILMPTAMAERLDTQQLRSIFLHELAHIKRGDLWVSLVQTILQIVYVYHPLLWVANVIIQRVREQAVDETVLAAMGDEAEDYPRTLVSVSKLTFGRPTLGLRLIGVVESKRALTARIKHIISRPFPRSAKLGFAGVMLVTAVAAVLLPMARAERSDDAMVPAEPNAPIGDATSATLTIEGVVTDVLGRPRECVYVAPQGQPIWEGVMSDAQGHFTLENVTPDQKVWMAHSQASSLNSIFRLPQPLPAQPIRVLLDLDEADIAGRVVGADGRALPDRKVELVVTTADGIRFPIDYRPKTDAFGYYSSDGPCGEGMTIEARVLGADGVATPFSTGSVKVRAGQGIIEMPLLAAAEQKIQPDFDRNLREDGMLHCRGRVVGEDGRPIAGVRVGMSFDMPGWMSTWVRDAMTDDQGCWHRAVPPQCMDLSLEFEHCEFYIEDDRARPPRDELEKGTHVVTMKRGLVLRGRVIDEQGEPVENALVCAKLSYARTPSPYNQIMEDTTTDRTRKDGTFRIGGLPGGARTIAAYSSSHAPTLQTVDIQAAPPPITVVLSKGRTYRGRVVDAQGQPIEGVRIGVTDWRVGTDRPEMSRLARTDAQGDFALTNLPEGQIELYFGKKTLMGFHRDLPKDPSQVDVLTMYEVPVFTGRVVDARTGEPIPEFSIANGFKRKREDKPSGWSRYHRARVAGADGLFTHRWGGYGISYPISIAACIKIQAPGYLPAVAPPLELGAECEPLTIRLRRGTPITGTVRTPDGGAASKAQVGLVRPGEKAYIDRYQFSERGFAYQAEIVERTDENGAFELPPTQEQGLLVAVHTSGCAQVPSTEFANGSDLALTAWSRVEGVIDRSRIEETDVEIALYALGGDEDRSVPSIVWLFDRISPTGDTFAFDFLPAVPLVVGRVARYEMNNGTHLIPEAGKTYAVAVGARGRAVTGRILFSPDVLKAKSIELTDPRQTHAVAFRVDEGASLPPGIGTIDESSFTWLWRDKERAYRPSQTVSKRFIPRIAEDGAFTFAGLEPGDYEFVVNVHAPLGENVSCGRGVLEGVAITRFAVPKGPSNDPLRVPDVRIQRLTYPGVGEPAPRFEAKTFEGKTVRLEDLRGRTVLLEFWATWCAPCVAQLPKMQALYETFAANEKFAMIGLSVDWDTEKAKRMVAERQLAWPQVGLGSMDESPVVRQYGVGGVPTTVLIGAEGKIIARGTNLDELTRQIEKALDEVR